MKSRAWIAASLAAMTFPFVAHASVIVDYNLTDLPNQQQLPSAPVTFVAPGLSATPITRGSGLDAAASLTRGFSSRGWNAVDQAGAAIVTTRDTALAGNKFYTFSVTVEPDAVASFTSIAVALYKSAISSPANFEWQYSFDGFATPGLTAVTFNHFGRNSGTAPAVVEPFQWMTQDTPGQNAGNATPPLDLSGVADLQNIPGGTTIDFRLYGWGSINGGVTVFTNTLALGRDLGPQLTGNVVVIPEPATLGLVGLSVIALVRRRSR